MGVPKEIKILIAEKEHSTKKKEVTYTFVKTYPNYYMYKDQYGFKICFTKFDLEQIENKPKSRKRPFGYKVIDVDTGEIEIFKMYKEIAKRIGCSATHVHYLIINEKVFANKYRIVPIKEEIYE